MDYKEYAKNLKRYNELDAVSFKPENTKEEVIKVLTDISLEKKRIKTENNEIIREYIEKYEKDFDRLDAAAEESLKGFMRELIPGAAEFLDVPITFRIARLLLRYYAEAGDTEQMISMLERCTVFDIVIKEHLDDYESSPYVQVAEKYLDRIDTLSEKARKSLVNAWLLGVVDRRNLTAGLHKYPQIKERFEKIQKEAEKLAEAGSTAEAENRTGKDGAANTRKPFMAAHYLMCQQNVLAFALEACRRTEYAAKTGQGEALIDMEKEAPVMEELCRELETALAKNEVLGATGDRVIVHLYCAQASYHMGKISLKELLAIFEECAKPHEEYNAMEQFSALFTANSYYMDYLYRCSHYEESYILEKSMEIVKHVMEAAGKMAHEFGNYQVNYCVLMLVNTASNVVDFDFFKSTVLNATVYANKPLYIHTLMAKDISIILLKYILEHYPQYLDGISGYSWEYCRDHKDEIVELMENCALFHDIGKYFCLDYVSNSSRSLTEEEFAVIKAHPANFSKIYQGKDSPQTICIHDCALLHHLWYNGRGGYPLQEKHTYNQPFINMISIADSIDAATDNIGRPYGTGKTLAQLMEEFDREKGTRYCPYVCSLLHEQKVQDEIQQMITKGREDVNYKVYMGL